MLVSKESPESYFTFTMLSSICRSLWNIVTLLYALVYHFEKSSIFLAASTMHPFKISLLGTPTCDVQSRVDISARPKAGSHRHKFRFQTYQKTGNPEEVLNPRNLASSAANILLI